MPEPASQPTSRCFLKLLQRQTDCCISNLRVKMVSRRRCPRLRFCPGFMGTYAPCAFSPGKPLTTPTTAIGGVRITILQADNSRRSRHLSRAPTIQNYSNRSDGETSRMRSEEHTSEL